MRRNVINALIVASCVFVCVLGAEQVFAQAYTATTKPAGKTATASSADAGGDLIRLRKLTGTGVQCLVKTPDFRTTYSAPGVKPPGLWIQITQRFDSSQEWIDELTFQFYAIAKDSKGGYSLYKNSVRYVDIEKGKDHMATMYVRPTAVKRYGQLVAVAVVISHGGAVIDEKDEAIEKITQDWWKKDDLPGVTNREGCLVDRSQSPFALLNIDDYEVTK